MVAYTLLIGLVVVERLVELVLTRRNAARAFARGGVEVGREHYPFMVTLHTALLLGCVAEVWLLQRPFLPALGWPMLALCGLTQALRWWVITTLGDRWNTRVIFVPGLPLVTGGPFRYLRHPNYLAVILEGLALPLVHTAWITALTFTILNLWLLKVRIGVEDQALRGAQG